MYCDLKEEHFFFPKTVFWHIAFQKYLKYWTPILFWKTRSGFWKNVFLSILHISKSICTYQAQHEHFFLISKNMWFWQIGDSGWDYVNYSWKYWIFIYSQNFNTHRKNMISMSRVFWFCHRIQIWGLYCLIIDLKDTLNSWNEHIVKI